MKKLFTILFLFVSFIALSQNNGINFQGVGRNSSGAVLASTKISLRFSVIQSSETGTVEYVESKEVTTNAQGIFSVVIGDGTQISKTGNFSDINWKINPKFLKVEMDPAGGTSFVAMGTTRLQSVPFAYYANGVNADNVDGILSASKGGTGVASISALKTALAIDQINNTSDLAKPISTATQAALDTKVSTSTISTTLATKANVSDLDLKANVTDVSLKANMTDLALKAPIESPTFTGTVSGITKAMVGLGSVNNTADLAKPISTATQEALDTKVSAATFSTTLATKVSTETFSTTIALKENSANKSTSTDLGGSTTSDILFPTQKAVKTYVDAQVNAGGVADGGITTNKLAAGAVTDEKVASGINKTKVGLGNVDNTADLDKPLSNATILALANKPSIDIRRIAKLDEPNSFTGDQQISGNLSLSNGILNLAGGTQIQSGTNSETTILNRPNSSLIISTTAISGNDTPTNNSWAFNPSGTLTFPNNSSIGSMDSELFIENLNGIYLNGGNKIENESGKWSEIFISPSDNPGSICISTTSEGGTDSQTINMWKFGTGGFNNDNNGFLTFPDGTGMGAIPSYYENVDPNFAMLSTKGIVLFGGISNENPKSGIIAISPTLWFDENEQEPDLESQGNIYVATRGYDELERVVTNTWKFDINGNLKFPDNTVIGKSNEVFSIESDKGIIIGGGGDYDSGKRAEISISPINLVDPDGNNIEPDDVETEGNIYLQTILFSNIDGINPLINIWKFDNNGVLSFPDGTTLAGNYSGSTYFELNTYESNGLKITTNGPELKTWEFNLDGNLLFPDGTELNENASGTGNFGFTLAENKGFTINTYDGRNEFNWKFKETGILEFPDGTTLAGNYSGSTYFDLTTYDSDGFKITTNGPLIKTWKFYQEGTLTFPDGTITSGGISGTSNFGFDTRATENGFSIITAGTSSGTTQLWEYNTDGSLTFPDGTITSGNISGTSNFGFDTRATENGFSIITGTASSSTQVWTFDSDGVLNLPVGGDIKIAGTSVLSNFIMEVFRVENVQSDYSFNQNHRVTRAGSVWEFDLEHVPLANQIAFYINGVRASTNNVYTIANDKLIINMLFWDNPPQSNYEFSIDYKY